MAYTFVTHITTILNKVSEEATGTSLVKLFALIDAAQLTAFEQSIKRTQLLRSISTVVLFEGSFAQNAVALSPILFELSDDDNQSSKQLLALDKICQTHASMSVIQSTLSIEELVRHLRELLLINADGTDYLLRFADTQMLTATNLVLMPSQRKVLFGRMQAWYIVDFKGQLEDMLNQESYPQTEIADALPLGLNTEQTNALLNAVALPMMQSQLRELEPSFAEQLSNVEQIAFVSESFNLAKEAWVDEEVMTNWILERWKNEFSKSKNNYQGKP